MSRGLKTALCGFVPILLVSALVNSVDQRTGAMLVRLSLVGTPVLFILGTALIAADKGYSVRIGILLGLISPIGTFIALFLRNKNELLVSEQSKNRPLETTSNLDEGTARFGNLMVTLDLAFWPCTVGVGGFFASAFSWILLNSKRGSPLASMAIGVSGGATYAAATAGMIVFWPLVFAPTNWLLGTERGRRWLARTGLRNQENTLALRTISFVIATSATGFFVPLFLAIIEAMTMIKPS